MDFPDQIMASIFRFFTWPNQQARSEGSFPELSFDRADLAFWIAGLCTAFIATSMVIYLSGALKPWGWLTGWIGCLGASALMTLLLGAWRESHPTQGNDGAWRASLLMSYIILGHPLAALGQSLGERILS